MDSRLSKLEAWREKLGLTKVALAALLKTPASQNYTNWLNRGSLPKEFYDVADIVVSAGSLEEAEKALSQTRLVDALTALEVGERSPAAYGSALSSIPDEEMLDIARDMIKGLSDDSRRTLLAEMLQAEQDVLSGP